MGPRAAARARTEASFDCAHGTRVEAKSDCGRGAMIARLAEQVAHLQTQIDGLAELKEELDEHAKLKEELDQARAELDEHAHLKEELHHARVELDEVAQLKAELHHAKAELHHAKSTEIPALKEHFDKLEAELNSFRVIPNNVTEATFDCGPQAYERAIEVLASNSHDHRDFQITALTEDNRMVARFSVPFMEAFEVRGKGLQDG